jgi:heme O synthase-like polyprenyltransferase
MKIMNSIKGKIALAIMLIGIVVLTIPALPVAAGNGTQDANTNTNTTTTTTTSTFANVTAPVEQLIRQITAPLLGIVGALGSVFCIILGVKFAKAEEPQEREKAKAHLKNAIIGFVLIFVLLLVLNRAITPLTQWVTQNANNTGL